MNKKYNEMLIRNIDCGVLYFNVKNDELIRRYESLKKEKKYLEEYDNNLDRLRNVSQELERISKEIHSFSGKNIKLNQKDSRFQYTGTIADSLMGRKLREVVKSDPKAIRTVGDTDYTDVIINIKFRKDILIDDNETKRVFDPESESIKEVDGIKKKCLISKKKLRKIAYRDGLTINGIHYVILQRTSSKARTGNCLFIDERYYKEMNDWQNMNIPFAELKNADIVGIKSYQSLISSSIIGELDIDPYEILLIDDASGESTMECNVVRLDKFKKNLCVSKEEYTQKTDLWDGQSLLDRSLFEGTQYEKYGFILLRNHFFKTAVFNTNLQDYYKERFKGIENPKLKDAFGNEYAAENIKMVTTRNSCKFFKFAEIICKYMVDPGAKERLSELENELNALEEEDKSNYRAVSTARRKLTLLFKQSPSYDDVLSCERAIKESYIYYCDNHDRLEKIMKEKAKEVKLERERLTWDWYRSEIKKQGQKFGCCKTEHKSKFGDKQQLWYQVIGSLNLSKEQLWELVEPQVKEINLMRNDVAWFKRGIEMKMDSNNANSMMFDMLNKNDDIARTEWYVNFRRTRLNDMVEKLMEGKIQIRNSDFCTLVGNPFEMLRASCGDIINDSIINDNECYCPRYEDEEELYGMRSPHICSGNNALLKNVQREEWKWFNFTDNIIVVNFFGKGAFLSPKWNGCDTDSDTAYVGNNSIILNEVKKVQNYLIPINDVPQVSKKYKYDNEEMAIVDGQLCNDYIGKICNFARDLQALYWHLYNTGTEKNKKKYLGMMYDDICLLEVLSNIAIDSAKRRYQCNISSEINAIKDRPYMQAEGVIIDGESIVFREERYKKSLSQDTIDKYKLLVEKRNKAKDEESIQKINSEIKSILQITDTYRIKPNFTKNLKAKPKKLKKVNCNMSMEERELNRQKQIAYAQEQKELTEKTYRKLESPMDILKELIEENIVRAKRTQYLESFKDILNDKPREVKVDTNTIRSIKKLCITAKDRLNALKGKLKTDSNFTYDDFYESKKILDNEIISTLKNKKITTWDIQKLMRDTYDSHCPIKDKHGKFKKNEKGRLITKDNRDPEIIENKIGGLMMQWLYAAHREEFLGAIKSGNVSYVEKLETLERDNYFIRLDGNKYVVRTKRVA